MMFRVAVYSTVLLTGSFCFGQMMPDPAMHNPQPATMAPSMTSTDPGDPGMSGLSRMAGGLEGEVRNGDNQPVVNARVELYDPNTGNSVVSTYTGPLGRFALSGIQRGTYDVVATSGIFDVREEVEVMGPAMTVTLRIRNMRASNSSGANVGDHNSVSVASLKVPDKARDELEKARKELAKSNFQESLKHVENSLAIAPNFAEALTERGILEVASNHPEEAQKDVQKAINSDSSYGLAYVVMGSSLNDEQKYTDAMRPLIRATELMPTSWQAHFEMSRALLGTGDFQHALKEVTRAEEMMPDFPPVHLVRAHALMGCKQYSDAITEYQKYLSKDPSSPQAESAREGLDEARAFAATGYVQ
jgi:Tfp pilus assembly protein PilF